MLRESVAASAALAVLTIPVAAILGHLSTGVGLAAGLVIGAFNAHVVVGVLDRKVPFVVGTIARLAFFSLTAIALAALLRSDAWSVLLGVGVAQVVMVVAAVRQGLRT